MTEKESLEQQANTLIKDFHSLPLYQRYLTLEKTIADDKHLQDIKTQEELLKKSLKFLSGKEKQDALSQARSLYESYENDPLVVTFHQVQDELNQLTQALAQARL
jgi:cell fate (sporulation/competence/biofilm development) regulator YmcA (YheA/YmcA/DUF963 family)